MCFELGVEFGLRITESYFKAPFFFERFIIKGVIRRCRKTISATLFTIPLGMLNVIRVTKNTLSSSLAPPTPRKGIPEPFSIRYISISIEWTKSVEYIAFDYLHSPNLTTVCWESRIASPVLFKKSISIPVSASSSWIWPAFVLPFLCCQCHCWTKLDE